MHRMGGEMEGARYDILEWARLQVVSGQQWTLRSARAIDGFFGARAGPAEWSGLLGLLASLVLQWLLAPALVTWLIGLNFDLDRATILAGALIAMPAALLGALLWRQRVAALVGALIGFGLGVALPFTQQALQPAQDALGVTVRADASGLVRAVLVLFSLATVASAVGGGLGAALGDRVGLPLAQLSRALAHWWRDGASVSPSDQPADGSTRGRVVVLRPLLQVSLVAATVAGVLWASGDANTLLFYGADALVHPVAPPPAAVTPSVAGLPGQVTTLQWNSPAFGGARRTFDIYLPPSYGLPEAQHQRYPVVYLLHGSPGHAYAMLHVLLSASTLNRLITSHQIRELILVAPDGNAAVPYPPEWLNSADGREHMEDALVHELVPFVDAHYRTIATPSGRIIGGLSMGGYGAVNLAVKHADVFGGVITMGAYFVPEGRAVRGHPDLIAANSPALLLPNTPAAYGIRFYLAAGAEDEPYTRHTRAFAQLLDSLKIDYTLQISPGGHSWRLWQQQIVAALRWFSAYH
ncbi:MAG: hypothetical protein PVSMB4_08850 [Ktedonobacterales bacterium]